MFDLDDLRTFVAVAEAGGVTGGANRRGISKSVASRQLAKLENELGVRLLSRNTRGAALTEAGVTFRAHAARAIAELEAARDELSPEGDLRGVLRIAAPLSFGVTYLAEALASLARKHPRLQIDASYSDDVVDIVREGYDAAIRIGYLEDSSLMARRIASVRARLVASPDYLTRAGVPTTLADLEKREGLLLRGEAWPFTSNGKTVYVRPRGVFRADNGLALTVAAVNGVGIAMLPDFLTDSHIASGALVPLLEKHEPPSVAIYVLRPSAPNPSRKVAALIEAMLEIDCDA